MSGKRVFSLNARENIYFQLEKEAVEASPENLTCLEDLRDKLNEAITLLRLNSKAAGLKSRKTGRR